MMVSGPQRRIEKELIEKELNKKSLGQNFSPPLEEAFRKDYFRKTLTQTRAYIVLGIFLYGVFGILDYFIVPEAREQIWFIRYAIVYPVLVLVLLSSFYFTKEIYMRLVFGAGILVSGYGIILMLLVSTGSESHIYYAGLMLVIFGAYVLVALRFYFATFCAWLLTISYVVIAIAVLDIKTPILINNSFFLVSANFIGMIGSYILEKSLRRDFLRLRLLGGGDLPPEIEFD